MPPPWVLNISELKSFCVTLKTPESEKSNKVPSRSSLSLNIPTPHLFYINSSSYLSQLAKESRGTLG